MRGPETSRQTEELQRRREEDWQTMAADTARASVRPFRISMAESSPLSRKERVLR